MKAALFAVSTVVLLTGSAGIDALAQGEPDPGACEGLIAQGRRGEAIASCALAYRASQLPEAGAALVRARLAGGSPPGVYDIAGALLMAQDLRNRFPASPWGYAAMCDIAERTGDDIMLQSCFKDLERVAAGHPATLRAAARVRALRPSWWVWSGWVLIAAASVAAAARVVVRAVRRARPSLGPVAAGIIVALAALAATTTARAEPGTGHPGISNFAIDDADPVKSIPTAEQRAKDPVEFGYWLMDLADKATKASHRGDHQAAIRYFTAMAVAVPERPVSFIHLCEEYEAVGDRDHALANCHAALFHEPVVVDNYVRYLQLAVSKPGALTGDDVAAIAAVIKHLHEDPSQQLVADDWECQLSVRLRNAELLEACTKGLVARAPDAQNTLVYQWTLALLRNDLDGAERIGAHARTTAMPPALIERLERDTATIRRERDRKLWLGVGAVFLGFIAALAIVLWLRPRHRESPRMPLSSDPPAPAPAGG
jgi:hypothetical protein